MNNPEHVFDDRTPGVEEHEPTASYLSYTAGLGLAIIATIASFIVAQTNLLWPPGIPVGLIVLALAQIGVHLVFFFHRRFCLDHRQSQHQHDADAGTINGEIRSPCRSPANGERSTLIGHPKDTGDSRW